ncbi:hypothetical protein ASC97_28960 [Rhizobium sp. Root1203]|uniref:SdpI family protein n=1 Tax=Rhizobium sp. Root1203 TaxID=1736427 RepID=UPI0007109471|nr:SdpI family protein [Rhizobium sp. Root1203]KQV19703.1 hypothetical protein ASC97_28960 [Rhizobium sp. Root1203]
MKSYVSPLVLALFILTLVTTVIGYLVVPAGISLPVHWGPNGEADGFAPRDIALAMPILVLAAVWGLFLAIARFAPSWQVERSRAMSRAALGMLSGIFLCVAVVTVLSGIGTKVDIVRALSLGVAGLLVVLGNAMPKSQPNSFAGLRTRTTLADPVNWHETHRFTGLLSIVGGIVLAIAAFMAPVNLLIWWIIVCVIVPITAGHIYSYRLAKLRARVG